jgi:competence protein ComEC
MTLLLGAAAFLAGTILAALDLVYAWPLLTATGLGAGVGLALAGRLRPALAIAALTVIALAGLARYELARPPDEPGGIAVFNGGEAVLLQGVITGEVEERERSQRFRLRVDAAYDGRKWQETEGSALVTTRPFPRFEYGDAVELRGSLETPPSFESFDYREYLVRQGVVSLAAFPELRRTATGRGNAFMQLLDDLRRPLDEALARSMPEPAAALARGILLGQRSTIPRDLTDDFNAAGISHLVAISGYNVMLVAGLGLGSLSWLVGRRKAIVVSMLLVLLFALFVGASPSVLRAALMAQLMLGAILAGRPGSGLTAVSIAAAVLTLFDPLIIDDAGFQLSFAATLGLVVLAQPLTTALGGRLQRFSGGRYVAENLAITAAASVAVLPVIVITFGRVSLVALPANVLATLAFPLILATSAATAVAGALSEDLGRIVGQVSYLPLAYVIAVGRLFASLPGASIDVGRAGSLEAVALVAVVALMSLVTTRILRSGEPVERVAAFRAKPALAFAALLLVGSAFALGDTLRGSPEFLTVAVLDVGQGDAILIETPRGHRLLVDGGPSGSRLMQALGRELPSSARYIDLVVLTHGQDDHVTGLVTLLERYEVGSALASPLAGMTSAYAAWEASLQREAVPIREAVAGEWLDLGDGVRLEVLGPGPELLRDTRDDLNNNSVVLRLAYGDVSFLLTGDLGADGEDALLRHGGDLRSTVLKVGHHGSDSSTTLPFLAAVRPAYAVISTGAENSYGHPSPSTQLRLAGVPFLRTDENGNVRFETDGRHLWAGYGRGDWRRIEPGANQP